MVITLFQDLIPRTEKLLLPFDTYPTLNYKDTVLSLSSKTKLRAIGYKTKSHWIW